MNRGNGGNWKKAKTRGNSSKKRCSAVVEKYASFSLVLGSYHSVYTHNTHRYIELTTSRLIISFPYAKRTFQHETNDRQKFCDDGKCLFMCLKCELEQQHEKKRERIKSGTLKHLRGRNRQKQPHGITTTKKFVYKKNLSVSLLFRELTLRRYLFVWKLLIK